MNSNTMNHSHALFHRHAPGTQRAGPARVYERSRTEAHVLETGAVNQKLSWRRCHLTGQGHESTSAMKVPPACCRWQQMRTGVQAWPPCAGFKVTLTGEMVGNAMAALLLQEKACSLSAALSTCSRMQFPAGAMQGDPVPANALTAWWRKRKQG